MLTAGAFFIRFRAMPNQNDQQSTPDRISRAQLARNAIDRISTATWGKAYVLLGKVFDLLTVVNLSAVAAAVAAVGSVVGVIIGVKALMLQTSEYDEAAFVRSQGSINLAWQTLEEANDHLYEIGQSAALLYLSELNQLHGELALTNSGIVVIPYNKNTSQDESVSIDLSDSALCGDDIYGDISVTYNFRRSILRMVSLDGAFVSNDFVGADLRNAKINNVEMGNAGFIAATLEDAVLRGGDFAGADFDGATLRGLKTERGVIGVGLTFADFWFGNSSSEDHALGDSSPEDHALWHRVWPRVFDPDMGRIEALKKLGMLYGGTDAENIHLVDFSDASFKHADLRGAHLENSNITQEQVKEACTDATTILPEGVSMPDPPCAEPAFVGEVRKAIRVYSSHASNAAATCKPE